MKDIGELFEKKLSKGKKKPSESVWEKINTSLDAEKSRKKRILYTWLVGAGLIGVFVLFLVLNNESPLQSNSPKQQDHTIVTNQSDISSDPSIEKEKEDNDTKELFKALKEDTLIVTNKNREKDPEIAITNQDSELNEKEKSSNIKSKIQQKDSGNKSKNNITTGNTFDKNSTVTKNYYYYNSQNNQTIVTQNKNEIDSLISEQNKFLDSVTTSKIDSLRQ